MPTRSDGSTNLPAPPFRVLVAYEDYQGGVRAMEVYNRFRRELEVEGPAELGLWKFEVLGLPALFEGSVEDALEADLIILSISGSKALPLEAVAWLEQWRGKERQTEGALVLVCDPAALGHPELLPTIKYLREFAQASAMEFIGPTPRPGPDSVLPTSPPRGLDYKTLLVNQDRHARRWGINE